MPQAISVTRRHLPDMAHVGDITGLHGGKLPPVDIISFGSPCQGLSAAGKRLGLADPRSGLFSEAVRIINEMRDATNGRYPRFALWENVPGAMHSNKGLDFKAVLEAFAESEVPIPRSKKWAGAGMVRSGRAHIAWCVYNAQYFGTAQRRRRIFLVADFAGESAGEILFVPKSLRGYFEAGGTPRQGPAAYAFGCADGGIEILNDQGGESLSVEKGGHSPTLRSQTHGNLPVVAKAANCLTPWDTQQSRVYTADGASPTLAGADGGGGRNPGGLLCTAGFCAGAGAKAKGIGYEEECAPTLKGGGGGFQMPAICAAFMGDSPASSYGIEYSETVSPTLKPRLSGTPCVCGQEHTPVYPINTQIAGRHKALGERTGFGVGKDGDPAFTLLEAHSHAVAVGVHQNQCGDLSTSPTAYTLSTTSNASSRNAPLVAHPKVSGTLCASGAGLSRPAGMASETDLCIVTPNPEAIPIQDKATRYSGGGETRKDDGSGNGLGVGNCGDPAPTITAGDRHAVAAAYCLQGSMVGRQDQNGPCGSGVNDEVSFTLNTADRHAVAAAVDCRNLRETEELSGTLQSKTTAGYSLNYQNPIRMGYVVRRLTPTECERLQGYPDGWTESGHDGKPISDTRRYQMLGNSVAVPCVAYIMQGIAQAFGRENSTGEEAA